MSKTFKYVLILSFIIIVSFLVSVMIGSSNLTLQQIIDFILNRGTSNIKLILIEFRLPRIIACILVAIGMSVAGLIIQGVTKNSLADPGILGINAGAGLGVIVFIFFFRKFTTFFELALPISGLIGAFVSILLIYVLSWKDNKLDITRLLLSGIALGTGLSALSLYISLKMEPSDYQMAQVWISGSMWNVSWKSIAMALPWLVVIMGFVSKKIYILDLLQLDEDSTVMIGVGINRERTILLVLAIFLISISVSLSGNIAFLGLIAPHIAKKLVGYKHRSLVIITPLVGIVMMIISDFIAKNLFSPVELPVGVIISVIGAPFFIYILVKQNKIRRF